MEYKYSEVSRDSLKMNTTRALNAGQYLYMLDTPLYSSAMKKIKCFEQVKKWQTMVVEMFQNFELIYV